MRGRIIAQPGVLECLNSAEDLKTLTRPRILYEMATGALPFQGNTSAAVFNAILNQTPTAPERLNPAVPAKLEEIINKALDRDRELRLQSAAELRAELRRLRRDLESAKTAAASGSRPVVRAPAELPGAAPAPVAAARALSRSRLLTGLSVAVLAALIPAAFFAGKRLEVKPQPKFHQITFRRRTIWQAGLRPRAKRSFMGLPGKAIQWRSFPLGRKARSHVL